MITVEKPGSPSEMLEYLDTLNDFRKKPGSPEEMLKHFGTKGMKWGVRKARETSSDVSSGVKSLKGKNKARKERNIKENIAKAEDAQKQIDIIKANPSKSFFVQHHRNNKVKELEEYKAQRLENADDIREGRLTDRQKKILIGVGVTAAVLTAYGAYKVVDSGMLNQIQTKDIPFKTKKSLTYKMSPDTIMEKVVEPINPGYGGAEGMGAHARSVMNCRRCTFAYEMRRRGNDVHATKSLTATGQTVAGVMRATDPDSNVNTSAVSVLAKMATGQGEVAKAMKKSRGLGDKIEIPDDPAARARNIYNAIKKQGDGARGELGVEWRTGGAHSMAWEVIKGKPVVFDTQTRMLFEHADDFEVFMAGNVKNAGITRLDNIELNEDFLKRWVKNV